MVNSKEGNTDMKNLESRSNELKKLKGTESIVDEYIIGLREDDDFKNVFQYTKEMASIIIFLAQNDREGTLFNFVTDYLTKMIDKGKNIRQEKGL
ncbi:MAG: hypothetical protein HZC47_07740 [Methanobacterium sp.]|uniref:hypothetical protein n=1 Tax=Methanobacterium sp. TaxID=2164 RepID=UPI003D65DB98|nr:hypothetical protein [Methanobacterium sp.]